MKKTVIVIALLLAAVIHTGDLSAATKDKQAQRDLSAEETLKVLQKMGITQGNPVSYVKSAATDSKEWWVHLFSLQQGDSFMPLLTYVNKKDVVVGILIRDGKIVMPKIPINEMQPSMNMSKVKLTADNRMAFNTTGKEVLYMFYDDSPVSQSIEQRLPQYKGKYKVIVKHFPLEQASPGAKERAVEKECLRLHPGGCDERAKRIAASMIDEDIQEGTALGIDATPFFITGKGNVLREIPDLKN